MSIPLVQEATKDAINTSIIAIKRNIERINMLLGLVDSGSPDLSGLATKQELEDAVNSLQPVDEVALNNMHSVTSNAVTEAIEKTGSYSTTEQATGGKWIDGKPIYRRVFEYYNRSCNKNDGIIIDSNFPISPQNVVGLKCFVYTTDVIRAIMGLCYVYTGSLAFYNVIFSGTFNIKVIIEYTKTTD